MDYTQRSEERKRRVQQAISGTAGKEEQESSRPDTMVSRAGEAVTGTTADVTGAVAGGILKGLDSMENLFQESIGLGKKAGVAAADIIVDDPQKRQAAMSRIDQETAQAKDSFQLFNTVNKAPKAVGYDLEPETVAGNIAEPIAQFFGSFGATSSAAKGMSSVAPKLQSMFSAGTKKALAKSPRLSRFVGNAATGVGAQFAGFEGDEQTILSAFEANGVDLGDFILYADQDDSEIVKRFKNTMVAAGMGGVVGEVLRAAKGLSPNVRKKMRGDEPDVPQSSDVSPEAMAEIPGFQPRLSNPAGEESLPGKALDTVNTEMVEVSPGKFIVRSTDNTPSKFAEELEDLEKKPLAVRDTDNSKGPSTNLVKYRPFWDSIDITNVREMAENPKQILEVDDINSVKTNLKAWVDHNAPLYVREKRFTESLFGKEGDKADNPITAKTMNLFSRRNKVGMSFIAGDSDADTVLVRTYNRPGEGIDELVPAEGVKPLLRVYKDAYDKTNDYAALDKLAQAADDFDTHVNNLHRAKQLRDKYSVDGKDGYKFGRIEDTWEYPDGNRTVTVELQVKNPNGEVVDSVSMVPTYLRKEDMLQTLDSAQKSDWGADFLQNLSALNKLSLDQRVAAQEISAETRDRLLNSRPNYTPQYVQVEDLPSMLSVRKKEASMGSTMKDRRGSSYKRLPSLLAHSQALHSGLAKADRNHYMRTQIEGLLQLPDQIWKEDFFTNKDDVLEALREIKFGDRTKPYDSKLIRGGQQSSEGKAVQRNQVEVKFDGVPIRLELRPDSNIAASFKFMSDELSSKTLDAALKPFTWMTNNVLKKSITLSPDFIARAWVSDTVEGAMASTTKFGKGNIPIVGDVVNAAKLALNPNDPAFKHYRINGGTLGGRGGRIAPDNSNDLVPKKLGEVLSKFDPYETAQKRVFNAYKNFADAGEDWNRFREFDTKVKQLAEKGYTEEQAFDMAIRAGRERSGSFDQKGTQKYLNSFAATVPFMNAMIAGADRNIRLLAHDPKKLIGRAVPLGVSLLAINEYNNLFLNPDGSRMIDDMSEQDRQKNIVIMNPFADSIDGAFTFRNGYGFVKLVDNLMTTASQREQAGDEKAFNVLKDAGRFLLDQGLGMTVEDNLTYGFSTMYDLSRNQQWNGAPIKPQYRPLQGDLQFLNEDTKTPDIIEDGLQAFANTTGMGKSWDPAQVDFVLGDTLGPGIYALTVTAGDMVYSFFNDRPETVGKQAEDFKFINNFSPNIKISQQARDFMTIFYHHKAVHQKAKELERARDDAPTEQRKLELQGQLDDLMELDGDKVLTYENSLEPFAETIKQYKDNKQLIVDSTNSGSKQLFGDSKKRDLMDDLDRNFEQAAKAVYEAYKEGPDYAEDQWWLKYRGDKIQLFAETFSNLNDFMQENFLGVELD